MTVDRWSNLHAKLNAMIEVMRNQNERLDRIESDLAEIKARLAHASPGYDMKCENCRMWWQLGLGEQLGKCWLQTDGKPTYDEEAPVVRAEDHCSYWQKRPDIAATLEEYEARMAGEQEEGR